MKSERKALSDDVMDMVIGGIGYQPTTKGIRTGVKPGSAGTPGGIHNGVDNAANNIANGVDQPGSR